MRILTDTCAHTFTHTYLHTCLNVSPFPCQASLVSTLWCCRTLVYWCKLAGRRPSEEQRAWRPPWVVVGPSSNAAPQLIFFHPSLPLPLHPYPPPLLPMQECFQLDSPARRAWARLLDDRVSGKSPDVKFSQAINVCHVYCLLFILTNTWLKQPYLPAVTHVHFRVLHIFTHFTFHTYYFLSWNVNLSLKSQLFFFQNYNGFTILSSGPLVEWLCWAETGNGNGLSTRTEGRLLDQITRVNMSESAGIPTAAAFNGENATLQLFPLADPYTHTHTHPCCKQLYMGVCEWWMLHYIIILTFLTYIVFVEKTKSCGWQSVFAMCVCVV